MYLGTINRVLFQDKACTAYGYETAFPSRPSAGNGLMVSFSTRVPLYFSIPTSFAVLSDNDLFLKEQKGV